MLVISPDPDVSRAISTALSAMPNLTIDVETSTLTGMNGRASKVAGNYDVVLFQTEASDGDEIGAIEAMSAARRPGSVVLALADSGIPLSLARALNRAGVDEVLPMSGFAADVSDQLKRLNRPSSADRTRSGRIIAVAQARGGIGATTLAVNLADQLAQDHRAFGRGTRRPVALVDLDLQFGTTGSMLDLPEQDTLHKMASDAVIPDAVFLGQSLQTTTRGLTVLAAPSRFAPLDSLRPEQVAAILDTLRLSNDYVIVDLPRALVGWIEPVLHRADRLMLVTDLSVPAIRHCRRLLDFVAGDNATLPVEIVVNRDGRKGTGPRDRPLAAAGHARGAAGCRPGCATVRSRGRLEAGARCPARRPVRPEIAAGHRAAHGPLRNPRCSDSSRAVPKKPLKSWNSPASLHRSPRRRSACLTGT
jgi:pilus assembly protein CpaE